ncbi:TIR domain-containing protein [Frankia sp. Ag45/Mut15]|uniref:TIR domain-containing protein n=1 Tax=Frankia umida TaxID=573489 RepID=A0ABT0K053_9ACTN|nr:TIR domain-containing protein [Frankia umida]
MRTLAENLERAGLRMWFDEWEVQFGQNIVHRMDAGIRDSRLGIVVVSPHSMAGGWVAEEYAAMLNRTVKGDFRLIPVLLADAEMPPMLATRSWVDFRQTADPASYKAAVRQLIAALRGERAPRPAVDGTIRPPPGQAFVAEGPRNATLRFRGTAVTLTAPDGETVTGTAAGLDWSAQQVLWRMQRARARRPGGEAAPLRAAATATATAEPLAQALRAAGRMLGERLLPHEIATRLATEVGAAVRAGVSLRLALDLAEDPTDATPETSAETPEASAEAAALASEYAELPWETLTLPGEDRPLVLHPSVELHRTVSGLGPTSAMGIPGPLRILAVIASPERGGGELLDHEAELARILDAVEPARRQGRGRAYVRILNWGSREAIHAALKQERFHILHISCHARPGELILETATGEADPVDASTFATKILIRDRGVPLVVLAGCSTALAARGTPSPAGEGEGEGAGEGEAQLPALARGLLAHGVPAVRAMTTSVSDLYATELTSRLYAELAGREVVDPLAALSDARRAVEAQRAALAEWATPTLYLRGPCCVRCVARGPVSSSTGLGGVGKSTLAAQLVTTAGGDDDPGLLVSLTGLVAVDQILLTVADRLHSWCLAHELPERDVLRALVGELRSGQTAWRRRLDLLAEHLLPRASVTLLLDNAEDVLTPDGPGCRRTLPPIPHPRRGTRQPRRHRHLHLPDRRPVYRAETSGGSRSLQPREPFHPPWDRISRSRDRSALAATAAGDARREGISSGSR